MPTIVSIFVGTICRMRTSISHGYFQGYRPVNHGMDLLANVTSGGFRGFSVRCFSDVRLRNIDTTLWRSRVYPRCCAVQIDRVCNIGERSSRGRQSYFVSGCKIAIILGCHIHTSIIICNARGVIQKGGIFVHGCFSCQSISWPCRHPRQEANAGGNCWRKMKNINLEDIY